MPSIKQKAGYDQHTNPYDFAPQIAQCASRYESFLRTKRGISAKAEGRGINTVITSLQRSYSEYSEFLKNLLEQLELP